LPSLEQKDEPTLLPKNCNDAHAAGCRMLLKQICVQRPSKARWMQSARPKATVHRGVGVADGNSGKSSAGKAKNHPLRATEFTVPPAMAPGKAGWSCESSLNILPDF